MHVSEKYLEQFVVASHCVASHGLVRSSSGNLSWRVSEEHMLIYCNQVMDGRAYQRTDCDLSDFRRRCP
jgi:hypothetical protein